MKPYPLKEFLRGHDIEFKNRHSIYFSRSGDRGLIMTATYPGKGEDSPDGTLEFCATYKSINDFRRDFHLSEDFDLNELPMSALAQAFQNGKLRLYCLTEGNHDLYFFKDRQGMVNYSRDLKDWRVTNGRLSRSRDYINFTSEYFSAKC